MRVVVASSAAMNILAVDSCGHITPEDQHLILLQGVTLTQARQVLYQLVVATRDTVHARFMGMDIETGQLLPPELSNWVITYDQVCKDLEDLRKQHQAET